MRYCLQCGHEAERKIPATDNIPRLVCPNCHYIHYENPKVICGSLVVHKHRVLLCRRAIEPQYGLWTLPAGFMENGETMAEGAARESFEEAEAVVVNPHLYCLYDIPDIGQIYSIYITELKDGAYGIGSESLDCALFTEEDIPWDKLAFEAVRRTLKSYFADRKQYDNHENFPIHQDIIGKDQAIKRY
ncbi:MULTISPECIES: NUDIX hydrolase [unclassified Psychrobacter]|uniref:NUDIX hydrolase n=1 Tax=Psychrobacter TaxID=497 RepID=UPI00043334D0|nr:MULTISPECIES: NUDIX hydrolase [unclassified Psychrobacter]MCG3871674.1 NUDIX hydrolase [Psychrobacter sp. Ps7]GAF57889.1 MutT/Nudix family protein [Psychrobacter sp. JCM 18902]